MSGTQFAQLLRDERDEIVARFISAVQRKDLSPPGTSVTLLIDHIPKFLDEIVAELGLGRDVRLSHDAGDSSLTAREHGEQRWTLGYDLEGLIREYGVLRHCIVEVAKEAGLQLSLDEFDVLAKCMSVGVAEAATAYVKFRDAELNEERWNLEFVAEAGQLLSSSLDYRSTLSRLTGLVVPHMADWCVVHLDGYGDGDMPLAHVDPQKRELLRELYRLFPEPTDSPYGHLEVMRSGEPLLVSGVEPDYFEKIAKSPEQLALLKAINCGSWIVVPLRVQEHLFGAMVLAYADSHRRYTDKGLVLASELARRAAVAIDNARLYEQSQQERSRVEAATRAKDEFVAMVSHELRTPLTAILGWMRLIRGGNLDEARMRQAFDVIERNAQAQSQLVADLLDISRAITGKIRINPSQVDLSSVVDMAIEGVRPAAEAKRVKIEVDVDREHALVRCDGDRLEQVVWNLLVNAVKFTPKQGTVRVRLRRVESDIELTVADTGEGISADFLPHVFESFRQFEGGASRSHTGLGIGLSIVKHLVELHGGSIQARSPGLGQGATFLVRLPIGPLVSSTVGIPRVPATKRETSVNALPRGPEGIRVLVVDDEPDARDLLAFVMETSGIDVRVAASAADAMKELSSYTPHVIVSDVGMPAEDGYSLIRGIRTLPDQSKRDIPAIALTAFARNEDRKRALVEGFNLHMSKPVEPSVLISAVLDLAGHVA